MNKILMNAIIDSLAKIELAEDDQIDEDFAVSIMESIAGILSDLTQEEKSIFRGFCSEKAKEELSAGSAQRADYFNNCSDYIGL